MKKLSYIIIFLTALVMGACQNKDIDIEPMKVQGIDASTVTCQLQGDDYIISWPALPEGKSMQVSRYENGTISSTEVISGTQYTHKLVDTNIPFTYVLKVTDGTNVSNGAVFYYTREGASKINELSMQQVESGDLYNALVQWQATSDATNIKFEATNGTRTISETIPASNTSYTISDVKDGEVWSVTLVAVNDKGTSLSSSSSLKIGKTKIGFLSIYATPEELIADGDDDEASAWLWLHAEYPSAKYVYFGDVKSVDDIEQFRVLFWLRDLEDVDESAVFTMPEVVEKATPTIQSWYKNGGSLLLWSHAVPYIENLGRIPAGTFLSNDRSVGTSSGSWNPDTWKMAVCLYPGGKFKKDASNHPIYKGLEKETTDRTVLIAMKGGGWTEDHNCLFFNYPSALTGIGNQEEACYTQLTEVYGIYPLATWDSQIDWVSQLNIWEAQQGNTEFKGTILCIGNGGCEFSMKNADRTPDKSAYPKNNPYQDNVLTLAKNSLEYLKTR